MSTATMFRWNFAPWKTGVGAQFGGRKLLGVLTVRTDEGVEGHSFLGSSGQGADAYAGPLMEFIKPMLVGRNPLDIGAIWREMWKKNRQVSTNAIGAVDVALWDIAGKTAGLPIHQAAGHMPRERAGLLEHGVASDVRGVRGGGAAVPGHGLDGAQDSPGRRPQEGHRDLRQGAAGGGRRHDPDAGFDVGVQLRGRAARGPRHRGDGLLLVRGPAGGGGYLQLREAEEQAGHSDYVHGVRSGAAVRDGAVDPELRD